MILSTKEELLVVACQFTRRRESSKWADKPLLPSSVASRFVPLEVAVETTSTVLLDLTRVTSSGAQRPSLVEQESWMLSTMPPTMSWWELRHLSKTQLSKSMALLSESTTASSTTLSLARKRLPRKERLLPQLRRKREADTSRLLSRRDKPAELSTPTLLSNSPLVDSWLVFLQDPVNQEELTATSWKAKSSSSTSRRWKRRRSEHACFQLLGGATPQVCAFWAYLSTISSWFNNKTSLYALFFSVL